MMAMLKKRKTLGPEAVLRQKAVLAERDPIEALSFAGSYPGADIEALQAIVMEEGDGWDACQFCKTIPEADRLPLLKKAIESPEGINSSDLEWARAEHDALTAQETEAALLEAGGGLVGSRGPSSTGGAPGSL